MGDNILNNFFILIGGVVLAFINLFKNFSLKNDISSKSDFTIFSKSNFQREKQVVKKYEDSKIYDLRELFLKYSRNKILLSVLIIIFILIWNIFEIEIALIYLILIFMMCFLIVYYPQIQQRRSYDDLNPELP